MQQRTIRPAPSRKEFAMQKKHKWISTTLINDTANESVRETEQTRRKQQVTTECTCLTMIVQPNTKDNNHGSNASETSKSDKHEKHN